MKRLFLLVIGLIFTTQVFSRSTIVWPALKSFHEVMSQTFHPMDEGNFLPIKSRSGELAQKAAALKKSVIPGNYSDKIDGLRGKLKSLAKQTGQLDKMIKKGATNDQIKTSLVNIHDKFHEIVGLCSDEGR